ncbi:MAG: alpha/beta fold hydrolase [Myxococcota bacterium]
MKPEVDGATVHLRRLGQGRPALLLHGVPDSAQLWEPLLERLPAGWEAFAPDLPGFHRSALPVDFRYELQGYADWVRGLLDALAVQQPVLLVLHDWGGIFGHAFACAYPERVSGILAMSYPFTHLYRWHAWARLWRTPLLGELSMALISRPMMEWEMRRRSPRLDPDHVRATWRALEGRADVRRHVLALYRAMDPDRFVAWGARALALNTPVQAVWGAEDPYVPSWVASHLRAERVERLSGVGHWVPLEAPEAVVEAWRRLEAPR